MSQAEALAQLDALRSQGFLDDDEYAERRQQVLGGSSAGPRRRTTARPPAASRAPAPVPSSAAAHTVPQVTQAPEASGLPVCFVCKEGIVGEWIKIDRGHMHEACFSCAVCRRSLQGGFFEGTDGSLLCQVHQMAQMGAFCDACKKNLAGTGSFITTATGERFHRKCFVCALCYNPLQKHFAGPDKKAYCWDCFKSMGYHM